MANSLICVLVAMFGQDVVRLPNEIQALLEERESNAVRLARTLGDVSKPGVDRCFAAYALGELRSDNYVDDMARFISLRDDAGVGLRQGIGLPYWFKYPVADALTKLGISSFPAMQSILASSDDEVERDQALRVICGGYALHLGIPIAKKLADATLVEWQEQEGDDKRRDRLTKALEALRRGDPWKQPK